MDSFSYPESLSFGVLQGSVLGSLPFTMYSTALSSVISKFDDIKHHLYADDTQIYVVITPINESYLRISRVSQIGPGLDGGE